MNARVYPTRSRRPPGEWWKVGGASHAHCAFTAVDDPEREEPSTYQEAISSDDANNWRLAMQDEYDSLIKNNTWILTQLPPGRKVIKNKWVFKLKREQDNSVQRYKARLVAKGFTQRQGVDYDETYSPVVKYDSLRIVLSIAAAEDLEISQLDVKTAFLYGDLNEEIYIEQPQGFIQTGKEADVCRLLKSLYGLKQASRSWNQKLDGFLIEYGLIRSSADPCVYFLNDGEGLTIVAIWVDDGLICSHHQSRIDDIVQQLNSKFEITSGPATFFVGLQILRDRSQRRLFLSQSHYIKQMLHKFGMENCKPKGIPADPHGRLTALMSPSDEEEIKKMESIPYREAVGSLMYAMVTTRPDIAYAVSQVAQFAQNPGQAHWEGVKRIFSYLAGTTHHGISFSGSMEKNSLLAYTDSDYAGDVDNRKSTTGYVIMLNNGPSAWCSKRQQCTTLSTTEAEYVAACESAKELVWLRSLLKDIGSE